jgi:hypothetical protein
VKERYERYEVARDLWEDALTMLDGCVPCQLYKDDRTPHENAKIHPYGPQRPFGFWEIDYIGPLITSDHKNEYLLTAIDYATSRLMA